MKAILLGPLQMAALCGLFNFSGTPYSYPESLETCMAFASGYPIANVGNPFPDWIVQGFPKRRIRLEAISTPKIEFDFVNLSFFSVSGILIAEAISHTLANYGGRHSSLCVRESK